MSRRTQLQRSIEQFGDDKAKQNSGNYQRNATRVLQQWAEWIAEGCPARDDQHGAPDLEPTDRFNDLDVDHCAAYARRLRTRVRADELAGSTANTYYAYLRAFCAWAVEEEHLTENPAEKNRATGRLPDDTPRKHRQQMWTPEQRDTVVRAARDRAQAAIDAGPRSRAARKGARDRALVALLAYSGLRAGEFLRDVNDDRRDGATWRDLSWPADGAPEGLDREGSRADAAHLRVLGKSQEPEPATVLQQALPALRSWYRILDPADADWPLFPTLDAPTLYATVREGLPENEAATALDAVERPLMACRDQGLVPPATTTETARRTMQRCCEQADIEIDGDVDYLQPHGGRRGLGDQLYVEDPRLAQDVLRHQDIGTTQDAYRERGAEDDAAAASKLLNKSQQ